MKSNTRSTHNAQALSYLYYFLIYSLLFILFSLIVFKTNWFTPLDQGVYQELTPHHSTPHWLNLNQIIDYIGDHNPLLVSSAVISIYLIVRGFLKEGLWFFLTIYSETNLSESLKLLFKRARPPSYSLGITLDTYAYPSGHSFSACLFFLLTLWTFIRINKSYAKQRILSLLAWGCIFCVGIICVLLGAHWTSDVIGGYILAFAGFFLSIAIATKFNYFHHYEKV